MRIQEVISEAFEAEVGVDEFLSFAASFAASAPCCERCGSYHVSPVRESRTRVVVDGYSCDKCQAYTEAR